MTLKSASRDRARRADLPAFIDGKKRRNVPLRILFLHSNALDVEHCVGELRKAHLKVSADVVRTSEQFARRLSSKDYDLVLAQHPVPDGEGPQILDILLLNNGSIPCIFLAGTIQPETVAELITAGAADCVAMDLLGHLSIAVRRALGENNLRKERDQTERKLRHSEARYRALVGNLTYGICRCSLKGQLLDVNHALMTMLGYPFQEELLAASYVSDLLSDLSRRAQLLGHSGGQDDGDPLEIEWKRKDGTALMVRLSGREVRSQGHKPSYEIIVEDVTQQRKLEDHLRQQAAKDPLTGLANYRHLVETVDNEIRRSERTGREFALLFLDLDGLKKINDRSGHLVGSQALCRLADVLCTCSRDLDTPARFGGDEFALVLPETRRAHAQVVARRIRESLASDGREPKLSVSVGLAVYPEDGKNVETLLGAADAALYAMKDTTHRRTGSGNASASSAIHKGGPGAS